MHLRAAQQIKFAKMPVRNRSGSSPVQSTQQRDGPEVTITSPSKRSGDYRLRRGSMGAVEAVKARARRDTTTSSDMSSENELDPSLFQRRPMGTRQPTKGSNFLSQKLEEDRRAEAQANDEFDADDSDNDSAGTDLSSEFDETAESVSILNGPLNSSPLTNLPSMTPSTAITPHNTSPKKSKTNPSILQDLPPPRPISVIQPVSALSLAIRARKQTPANPIEGFATLSGKGSPNPLHIKIYAPFSADPDTPYEMALSRLSKEGDPTSQVTVAEAIGLSIWRYQDKGRKPPMEPSKWNVNRWTLRMVEDGEVDFDFPALGRTRPMVDFTSNNNRARPRAREKPWDEFALVEASQEQFAENERLTPKYSQAAAEAEAEASATEPLEVATNVQIEPLRPPPALRSQLLGQPFASALDNNATIPADRPAEPVTHATPRLGVTKVIKVRFLNLDSGSQTTTMEVALDAYIAEVMDYVCKKWGLDKANYVLKISGTQVVAELDRTLEVLKNVTDLDLVRRRFGRDGGLSLAGSPGSSSPNAPLLIGIDGPKKGKRGLHPLAQKQDLLGAVNNYKRFTVTRKQPMSFSGSSQRVLAFDGEFLHILPGDNKTTVDANTKTTSIPFGAVIGFKVSRKHPKMVRVIVWRENANKRYDFEAHNAIEAKEIVDEIEKSVKPFREMGL
jgi:target of rapamycin complex 2 subunit MAPKAP1